MTVHLQHFQTVVGQDVGGFGNQVDINLMQLFNFFIKTLRVLFTQKDAHGLTQKGKYTKICFLELNFLVHSPLFLFLPYYH